MSGAPTGDSRQEVAVRTIPGLNHPRSEPVSLPRVVEEMKGHAMAYFTEQGDDCLIGEWMWRLAHRIEEDLCPTPQNVIPFPTQRKSPDGNLSPSSRRSTDA